MDTKVVVYQIGKVGSQTIVESLRAHGRSSAQVRLPAQVRSKFDRDVFHTHSHTAAQEIVNAASQVSTNLLIVSAVRNPLERAISSFFENITPRPNGIVHNVWNVGSKQDVLQTPLPALMDFFTAQSIKHMRGQVGAWFECFGAVTGRSPFDVPFDTEEGIVTYRAAYGEALIFRLENMANHGRRIARFLRCDGMNMVPSNKGHEKWYSKLYSEFVARYRQPTEVVEAYYDDRAVRHFYSGDQINGMRLAYSK